jgi:hypothetical protein
MLNVQFDPITTEMVIGKRKKTTAIGGGSSATLSALLVPVSLELLVNSLTVLDNIQITDTGSFTINTSSSVEVR